MAVIAHVRTDPPPVVDVNVFLWETLTEADTAEALRLGGAPSDILFEARGTPGASTLILQGSNDGTNWYPLNDVTDTAVSLTVASTAFFAVRDAPPYVRPSASGGTSQDWDITISVRRAR